MSRKPQKDVAADTPDGSAAPAVEGVAAASSRPTLEELEQAELVEVRYIVGPPGPVRVAGLCVTDAPAVFAVSTVRELGASFMRALAVDETISVRIVK